ncbi:MAG: hypothetical protein EXS31_10740 [Pedosphaera sp.]|nr:hypothetical protein [Pedosphaera sp.]
METSLTSLVGLTAWLLRVSAQASVVIGLVLMAQWLFKKWLSLRWRYCLWSLVLIRLLLPVSPESGFSIFNFTRGVSVFAPEMAVFETSSRELLTSGTLPAAAPASPSTNSSYVRASAPSPEIFVASTSSPSTSEKRDAANSKEKLQTVNIDPGARTALSARIPATNFQPPDKAVRAPDRSRSAVPTPPRSLLGALPASLSLLWLGGAMFLLARIIWFPLRLNAQLARHEIATGPAVFELLEQSKRLIGVNQVLPVIQSRAVTSPALMGFIRPWLLLPDGMVERFTAEELRFVFLHELAHLKRRDIAVNWLMTILQILHWFNPLVWFAFNRMRADRELACDELALSFAKAGENKTYGQAIIKLLEGFTRPAVLPGLVGILEDKQQMRRRIIMIAQFKKLTQWPAVAFVLLLALGLVTLTDAQSGNEKPVPKEQLGAATATGGAVVRTLLPGLSASQYGGVLAPDETKIAYREWSGNAEAVFVKDLKTRVMNKVTTVDTNTPGLGAVIASEFVWSPDSKQIAYCWFWYEQNNDKSTNNGNDLRIVSASNGQFKVIKSHNPEIQYNPTDWSNDDKSLLCELKKKDGTAALATVSIDSGEVRQLLSFPWETRPRHARFSPDGKFIAYERKEKGNRDIYVLNAEGTQANRLTDWPSEESKPIWSPDGKYVLFSSNRSGAWELLGIEVKNGKGIEAAAVIRSDFGDRAKRMTRSGNLAFDLSRGGGSDVYLIDVNPATGESGSPKLATKSFYGYPVDSCCFLALASASAFNSIRSIGSR